MSSIKSAKSTKSSGKTCTVPPPPPTSCGPCGGQTELKDTKQKLTLTRQTCQPTTKCVPVTTIQWSQRKEAKNMTKCEQVPVPDEKCVTVKTTKCKRIVRKVPVEKVKWEKKCTSCTKVIEKKVLVPCTKTIEVPTHRVEICKETVPDEKVEWVKKCWTEYEEVSDYEEVSCEEKIKVPTWKMEKKNVNVCEEELRWVGKEVIVDKVVDCHKPCEKKYEACVPVKKVVSTYQTDCVCDCKRDPYLAKHCMKCNPVKQLESPTCPGKPAPLPPVQTIPPQCPPPKKEQRCDPCQKVTHKRNESSCGRVDVTLPKYGSHYGYYGRKSSSSSSSSSGLRDKIREWL